MNKRIQLLIQAKRLIAYAQRVEKALQSLDSRDHQNALADVAEAGEIARRLYLAIQDYLKT